MAAKQEETHRKTTIAVLRAIGIAILAVVLLFAAARVIAGTNPSDLLSVLTNSADTAKTEGYILETQEEEIRTLLPFSSGCAMLGKEQMFYVQSGGKSVNVLAHTYSDPQVAAADRCMLLYDLGADTYRLEKNGAVFAEKTSTAPIMCAAVGKKGNYAVATYAYDGYQSRLYVYEENGELLYEWGSARDFITRIALSDDGKQVAVGVVGSSNADYFSKLFVFAFGDTQPLYSYTFTDTTLVAVEYMKNDTIAVVTDSFVSVIKDGIEEKQLSYVAGSLLDYSVSHGDSLAVLLRSGAEEHSDLRVYAWDRSMKPFLSGLSVADECSRLQVNAKHLVVAGERNVYQFDKNGNACGTAKTVHAVQEILLVGNTVYCLTENGLYSFSVYNRVSEETSSPTP